ncbi:MAG: hypothetical protein IPP27_09085 [Bacteroidetes bacterium]|nr:hypothetical protein [Bacteroidota bacterium]
MDGRGSCASISDSSGNLLFYTETYVSLAKTIVWNSMHDTMYNGADSIIGDGLYNELQIIPFPETIICFIFSYRCTYLL